MRPIWTAAAAAAVTLLAAAPASADWVHVRSWSVPGPESVAVAADGTVLMGTAVGGGDNDGVVRYAPDGTQLARFGVTGREPGQFDTPWGLATDRQRGQLVVVDIAARAQTFALDGTFLGGSPLTLGTGKAIAVDVDVDPAGDRWFAADAILRADANGNPLGAFGAEGSGPGQLEDPQGVASDGKGNVFVADTGNHRVQRFRADGTPVAQWGQLGNRPGQFGFPRGIAVDDAGTVLVADTDNSRVQQFTPDGRLLATAPIPRDVGASRPSDLDVAPNGDLVVMDKPMGGEGTIHVLRPRSARVASGSLRRGARVPVKVRCVATTTCRGTVTIAGVGRATYRVAAGRTATVRVKPTRSGRARLAAARKLRVTVKPRTGAGETRRLRVRG